MPVYHWREWSQDSVVPVKKLLLWLGAELFTEADLAQSGQASLLRACHWQNVNLWLELRYQLKY